MVKVSNKRLLVVALVMSLLTAGLIYNYLKNASVGADQNKVPVVVAKVDIPPKTKITADMVRQIQVPSDYVQSQAMRDINMVVGITSREFIANSEQITERQLVLGDKPAGFSGLIPADKRAVTIAVNDISGVAGMIKPGDYVDVVATFDSNTVGDHVSKIMLQNILVLAVNRTTETGTAEETKDQKTSAKTASTVTLAVTPAEATELTLTENKGKVHLALRPFMTAAAYDVAMPVTPKDIVGSHTAPAATERAAVPPPAPAPVQPLPPSPPSGYTGGGIQMIRGTQVETIPIN